MVEEMKWNDEYKMYYYWGGSGGNKCHWITNGVVILDQKTGKHGVFEGGRWTEVSGHQSDDKPEKRRKVEGKKRR